MFPTITSPNSPHETFIFYSRIISLLLYLLLAQSADEKYETCSQPRICGADPPLTIKYPFFIPDQERDFCGYPGFHIVCKENKAIYNTSHGEYIVRNISYEDHSFKIVNSKVLNSKCIPRLISFALDRSPFIFDQDFVDLKLLYSCNETLSQTNYTKLQTSCEANKSLQSYAALDPKREINCEGMPCLHCVAAPVELEGTNRNETLDNNVDYEKLLENGFSLRWDGISCNECEQSGGFCGFDDSNGTMCFCSDQPHRQHCYDGVPIVGIFIFLLAGYILWLRKKRRGEAYLLSRNLSYDPSSKSDVEDGSFNFGIPIFSYTELVEATCNFDPSKELGDGGFGTVYYGKLRDGREVAIKRLYEHNYRRVEQFLNEIKILTSLRHPNLVSLYGCTSRRSRELLLVYEYIPNGTVADHLHGERAKESPLTWPVRMSIARETAAALAYLHKSDIIHRDVKTNNILLDSNFSVKVADFGLSRLFPIDVTHISTAPQGTPGYVDPEYHQCYQLTDKSDVYSFGVVLIELISSMTAVDISRHKHEINLANLAVNKIQRCAFDELIDPSTGYNSDEEVTRMTTSVAELAFRCLQLEKDLRPSMDEVVAYLSDIQTGQDCDFEKMKEANGNGKIPPSPETDEAVLLKSRIYQSSPTAVTDTWISGSSNTSSSVG
ncbi:hypothetical protein C2S52_016288 [Perilla frutescens var. hirtella]|nr:hypothetical protein C2S52_016288 [Perilla frutescens var. hirtella]